MRNNDERTGAVQQQDSPAPSQKQMGQNTLNFVAPTEFVEIPSLGKFYREGHPLHGVTSVEIKQMTAIASARHHPMGKIHFFIILVTCRVIGHLLRT